MKHISTMHQAAQYLAAAGISFLQAKEDDSHTNLAWLPTSNSLATRALSPMGDMLALSFNSYSLDFIHPENGLLASYSLNGAKHHSIVQWIERERKILDIKGEYDLDLHYQLQEQQYLDDSASFPTLTPEELVGQAYLRNIAFYALQKLQKKVGQTSDIRVWPHHFDTAMLVYPEHSRIKAIGVGMAIPDALCDEYYFYVSAYNDSGQISPEGLDALEQGTWMKDGWKGAVLPANGHVDSDVVRFFEEAIQTFQRLD